MRSEALFAARCIPEPGIVPPQSSAVVVPRSQSGGTLCCKRRLQTGEALRQRKEAAKLYSPGEQMWRRCTAAMR